MYRDIATTLYRRGEATTDGYKMPDWTWIIVVVNFLVFLPMYLIVSYTFQYVYPTLAIVEDPSPPAYEPVSLNEDGQSIVEDAFPTTDRSAVSEATVITASLRSTHRAVYAIAGWRSLFRGYGVYASLEASTNSIAIALVSLRVPSFIAVALAALATVQFHAAWTHIVISTLSSKSLWQRIPPFTRAFKATALPVVLHALAVKLAQTTPHLVASVFRMNMWSPHAPTTLPQHDKDDIWKGVLTLLAMLTVYIFLVIPTRVALTRVQASFLPEEDDTIIPFDRTFGGKVEPVVVTGKGYVNMFDAWKRFSRASWIRLVKLYCKIFLIVIALSLASVLIVIPEYILIANRSRQLREL